MKNLSALRGLWRSELQKRVFSPRLWLWLLPVTSGSIFGQEGSRPPFSCSSNTKCQTNLKLISYRYSAFSFLGSLNIVSLDSPSSESHREGKITLIFHQGNWNSARGDLGEWSLWDRDWDPGSPSVSCTWAKSPSVPHGSPPHHYVF